jgi:hypothetical protein
MSGIIVKIHVLAWTPAASSNERRYSSRSAVLHRERHAEGIRSCQREDDVHDHEELHGSDVDTAPAVEIVAGELPRPRHQRPERAERSEVEAGEAFEDVSDVVVAVGDALLAAGRAEAAVHGGAAGGAPGGGRLCHAA